VPVKRSSAPARIGNGSVYDDLKVQPAAPEVFERCCIRIARGDDWGAIATAEGLDKRALWSACAVLADRDKDAGLRWNAAQRLESAIDKLEVKETGRVLLRTARAELPSRQEEGETDGKPFSKRTYDRAANAAAAGAALLDPGVHGKQARGGDVNVNVGVALSVGEARAILLDSAQVGVVDVTPPPA
jgi:hypothetical protein